MNSKWKKIFTAVALCFTVYHILPTAFYYAKPLNAPVSLTEGKSIIKRWDAQIKHHNEALFSWINAYAKGLGIDLIKLKSLDASQRALVIECKTEKEAELFEKYFSKAMQHLPYKNLSMSLVSKDKTTLYLIKKYPTTALNLRESLYLSSLDKTPFKTEETEKLIKLLQNPQSPLIAIPLTQLAIAEANDIKTTLKALFEPESADMSPANYPLVLSRQYQDLSLLDQESCLIIQPPFTQKTLLSPSASQSLFVIAKNLDKLLKESPSAALTKDVKKLTHLLSLCGFKQIPSTSFGVDYKNDQIFELKNSLKAPLALLEEPFLFYDNFPYALCQLGTLKERLWHTSVKEAQKQEALVTWSHNYNASLDNLKGLTRYSIAKPTQNPFLANCALKAKQFFSGDAKKALKFGLDLSGGKNILIELEHQQGKKVTDPLLIKTAISELYERVNHLGVSEVMIRQEGDYISLDFPGSQNLSAHDLVNSSQMLFHIVNEEFSPQNHELYPYVYEFLESVWHEAVQKGQTDPKALQEIAYQHLSTPLGQKLADRGLKLANPKTDSSTDQLDATLSKIVKIKKTDEESSCPLMIVFNNYALEGVALKDIQCSYDPTKGNFLSFNIHKAIAHKMGSPQETLANWTTHFTKHKAQLPFKATEGWRMAVLLNAEVVSAPVLQVAIKDSASITGNFSQQDLLKLKADLQAGALSFQPKIILEQNIAPELGAKDKISGLLSMAISLVLVTALMTAYYRFHGVVATTALILNLLMLFAAAVFFHITLSLASIAGIILTLGMAVDANVLIFERMKEEKLKGISLKEAVHKGYLRAFSAIIDSNLTTMIAAGVLLGFDSGPIKGFALTLLLGLITSLLTALVMTRLFYFDWVEKTKVTALNFASWFNFKPIDFFKQTKPAVIFSALLFLVGASCFYIKFNDIVGMDFKGGYAVNLKLMTAEADTKEQLNHALIQTGLKPTHIHTQELDSPAHIRVFLDPQAEKIKAQHSTWSDFFVSALDLAKLKIEPSCLEKLDRSMTTISGQLSESMTRQAVLGLLIALGCIFIYVLIRFQWPYALAATVSLLHDIVLTLSAMALLAYSGVAVNLDLSSLAALLTIMGYSLNDTIIVFDRIREELKAEPRGSLKELISRSLNKTLSRTLLTSGTTLIVLIPMLFVGQGTLFNFSLVMTLGVILGTLSTLYIASPLVLLFLQKTRVKAL